ncbi:MAG: hypothetical protein J6P03_04080 [Opitutales bacterium]|nr:hypothetical protein [Opitutales bacterium]
MFGLSAKFALVSAAVALPAAACFAGSVLDEAVKPAGSMKVLSLEKNPAADIALIGAGARDGVRPGLRLKLIDADGAFGEMLVVESSLDKSAALILGDVPAERIAGAQVRFGIVK